MKFRFAAPERSEATENLRQRVRAFLAEERAAHSFRPQPNCWIHFDEGFSRRCGERGFIGVIFPREYGGGGGTTLERYVVYEEMLAAGAPVGLHWIADRQSGPAILKHGSETARQRILPEIAAGRCCIGIGMSEAGAGSDLAAVRTRAERAEGGWRITGSKLWTSHAHRAQYMIALVRTAPAGDDRHSGLTQFLIDVAAPGVRASPIADLTGGHDFNEVALEDVFVPDDFVLGKPGEGWALVMGELAYERSGPDRFLSTYPLLVELIDRLRRPEPESPLGSAEYAAIGQTVAHLATLRSMSVAVAGMLADGKTPEVEAALVKDLGTSFEQEIPRTARRLVECTPQPNGGDAYSAALAGAILAAPSFSLRGGTREILRSIIARQLGLR